MSTLTKKKLTEAEYLAIERAAELKSEFYNGEMFAMAGASRQHNEIKENLSLEIGIRLKGGPCRTYSADQRVKIDRTGLYTYPDLLIVCGRAEFDPDHRDILYNPQVIIEILSKSTESYDRGLKFLHMACLADNKRMLELARKFDAELSFDFSSVVGEVRTPRPTPLSVMREILADSHGFATAMLDVQSRLLKPV